MIFDILVCCALPIILFQSRTDKDKTTEIEILSQSLQHIEREYQILQEEAPRLRLEVERLKRVKVTSQNAISNYDIKSELWSFGIKL